MYQISSAALSYIYVCIKKTNKPLKYNEQLNVYRLNNTYILNFNNIIIFLPVCCQNIRLNRAEKLQQIINNAHITFNT